jgi:hypothetical protein
MRKILPAVLVLAGLLLGPAAFAATTVEVNPNDTSAVRVKGTTEGGLASQASLPGQEPKEKSTNPGAMVGDYFLHRFLDLVDIIDFSIGAGPGFLINVRATKLAQAVGGISDSWRIGFRGRSAGVWREKRRECGVSLLYYQKVQRERITGWVESFRADEMDLDTADVYGGDKDRAFTGIGATIHVGILVDVNVQPMQAVDFILGIFTIDVLDDDYGKAVRNKDL